MTGPGRSLLLALALLSPPALFAEPTPAPAAAKDQPAAIATEKEEAPQFIRVEKQGDRTLLQTALVHYTKGGATLDLVGAVHIADRKYYHDLNQRFEGYDALLFEGIGSDKRPAADPDPAPAPSPTPEKAEKAEETPAPTAAEEIELTDDAEPAAADGADAGGGAAKKPNLGGLHNVYRKSSEWLGLSYQMEEVDYRKANFVHADLSAQEFFELQSQRGESVLGFALKAGLSSGDRKRYEPNSYRMLASLVTGNKNGIKRELVHSLGQGDDQVAGFAGASVIIGERNEKCLQVLDQQVQAGKKKLGIFYGAAHFPDMDRRLQERGWTPAGTDWLTAWEIGE